MALRSSYLVGLLALGFFILILNWPVWLGLGVIVIALALAVSSTGDVPERIPNAIPQAAAAKSPKAKDSAKPPPWAKYVHGTDAKGNPLSSVEDLKWRPSVLADGAFGICSLGKAPVSMGPRQGTLTIDCGPIRFKDDLRFRPGAVDEGFKNFMATPDGKPIFAWHFRTQKPVFQEKTRMLESTMDQLDKEYWDWMNELPGEEAEKKGKPPPTYASSD
jgi:hypothetical protein